MLLGFVTLSPTYTRFVEFLTLPLYEEMACSSRRTKAERRRKAPFLFASGHARLAPIAGKGHCDHLVMVTKLSSCKYDGPPTRPQRAGLAMHRGCGGWVLAARQHRRRR
jgi:hypothetical protein